MSLLQPQPFFHHTYLPVSADTAWDWHTRPGAVVRLTPGIARMTVTGEADNLRDGTTTFRLPGGVTWRARHQSEEFEDGRRFTDVLESTPRTPLNTVVTWRHQHEIDPTDSASCTVTDTITANVPDALLSRIANYRDRQLTADLRRLEETRHWDSSPLTIAVTGATGTVGTQLVAMLQTAGHTVISLSRTAKPGGRVWDPKSPADDLLDGVDVVVHLAGAPIAGRFTDSHRKAVRESRVGPTYKLAELAAETPGVTTFICASAVGYYGADRPEAVTEESAPGTGFLAGVVSDWEDACQPARDAGLRVANIRTGLVLAGGSPLLTLLGASSRIGGGPLGSGGQHFPWVAVDDLVDIYHRAVVGPDLSGPVNAVAPEEITQADFAAVLADLQALRIPFALPVPALGPQVLLGREGAEELALADQHVLCDRLSRADHRFRFTTVREALRHELALK
ncbi:MAG TPA: TIGR01777 family oxidoreductase [Candidatus Corynebacterium avicola]|uniref:TIGR01777 family oxidoreductase n=1 Tax=Candidatus Corynebacterium avicola TaxID=2838527 RepID=A0A9D1RL94_9CORY|nr:TIGR01777 family oxidoreductase [Candidatus Corynebacterium avicola]